MLRPIWFTTLLSLLFALTVSGQQLRVESFEGRDVAAGEILVKFRNLAGPQAIVLAGGDPDIQSSAQVGRTGVVRLKSRGRRVDALLRAYRQRIDVLYAEPNYLLRAKDFPNDEFAGKQWALRNIGQEIEGQAGKPGADIGVVPAWNITEGSRSVVVGVLDGGIDYNHPDLAANVWSAPTAFSVTIGGQVINCAGGTHGFNAVTRTCDPQDEDGHGTFIAGIIGAVGNNGFGITGVNRVSSLMGLKFIDAYGVGTTSDLIAAMEFAIQIRGVFPDSANLRVINGSFGNSYFSQALLDEVNLLNGNDMLFVVAAGNEASTNDLTPSYPASFKVPNIVSVAATDNQDRLADFSNWGPTTVHLAAPGVDILSTVPNGPMRYSTGTSMSAPMVAGAAALVLSVCPLTTPQLKATLLDNVQPLPSLQGWTISGGRLNVNQALLACLGTRPGFDVTVLPGTRQVELMQPSTFQVAVAGVNGFSAPVELSLFNVPSGMTATLATPLIFGGSGTSTLTVTASNTVEAGTYLIGVRGMSGGSQRISGIAVTVGFPISPGQTIAGELTSKDAPSPESPDKYGDLFKLTLTSTTDVAIDLKSRTFDGFLYVRSGSGQILYSNDDSGSHNDSRIQATLGAGTYSVEVTTSEVNEIGRYTLSINTPTLMDIKPYAAGPDSVVNVTFTGDRFASPMTIEAGAGITVTDVNVITSNVAQATFILAANAAMTPRDVIVRTSEGVSNPLSFTVASPLQSGQRVSGSLSATDHILVDRPPYRYVDIYKLTIDTSMSISIDLQSHDFDAYLYLISSTGDVLFENDYGSTSLPNARIIRTLSPGIYFIEATSSSQRATGDYEISFNLPTLEFISPPFLAVGSSNVPVTLYGTRFSSGLTGTMTIDAGAGVAAVADPFGFQMLNTARFTVSPAATPGLRNVTVTTFLGTSNSLPIRILPVVPILPGRVSGTLTESDQESMLLPGSRADLYRINATTTTLAIDLVTADFRGHIAVLSSAGAVLSETDDFEGTGHSRVLLTVTIPGTYFIEVTSKDRKAAGPYTLGLNTFLLTSISPLIGTQGTSVDLSFSGQFLTNPLTIDAGSGIAVTNQTVSTVGSTANGTARLIISADAAIGPRRIHFIAANGTDDLFFHVLAPVSTIGAGQTISGTLSGTDQPSVTDRNFYADYFMVSVTNSPVVLELTSPDFEVSLAEIGPGGDVVAHEEGKVARLRNLGPGTHLVEVSSLFPAIGSYTLSVLPPPVLTSITPNVGSLGGVFGVVLTGSNFTSSMEITATSPGVTFSDVAVYSSALATAVVSIPLTTPVGSTNISVLTSAGRSSTVPLGIVASAPAPVIASRLSFTKFFSPGELGGAGFAVVNPAPTSADVRFSMYNTLGVLKGFYTESVPAGGQTARVGNFIFPAVSEPGWIEVTSATPGLQGFWLGGDFTTVMDGADSAVRARDLSFSLVTPATEIHIVGAAAATLTIRIYGANGNELAVPVPLSVVANGGFQSAISQLFPSVSLDQARYIRVSASADIMGTTVTKNYPVTPSWVVLNGIDSSALATEANFPHVPTGFGWTTIAGITNLSTNAQTVTFTFFPDQGTPVSVTRNLAGRGAIRESAQELFSFDPAYREGWIKVTGAQPLTGYIVYGYSTTAGAAAVPVQTTPRTSMIFSHVATGPQFDTGIGLLNATTRDANVEVYVMRRTGELVGGAADVLTASFTLGAGRKTARLLDALVPASIYDDGFVYVRSTNNVPLYALEVFFTRDAKVISNVPAGVLDPALGYAPPAPQTPLPPMTISSLSPSTAPRGAAIIINGAGFDPIAANNTVVFTTAAGAVSVPAASATPGTLSVTVPSTAVTGSVFFTAGGRFSNSVTLTVP